MDRQQIPVLSPRIPRYSNASPRAENSMQRKRKLNTGKLSSESRPSSELPVCLSRFSQISTPALKKCWHRVVKCSAGFQMLLHASPLKLLEVVPEDVDRASSL